MHSIHNINALDWFYLNQAAGRIPDILKLWFTHFDVLVKLSVASCIKLIKCYPCIPFKGRMTWIKWNTIQWTNTLECNFKLWATPFCRSKLAHKSIIIDSNCCHNEITTILADKLTVTIYYYYRRPRTL